ncbi:MULTISPECIES: hypothetical protein [Myxococcus]|uniref:Uncharacterized protein n=1 Tax=Myxococcus xanthus TaxID=34 RepID=A0AAE6FV06_MYXXA|nr:MULTISPECIES: hypothetical protein [Myxococcus]QDE65614.1 hypothetical protein BHS09_00535 [Myxococcus xanthus]QDE72887.1 hypothetical protein BHS08_00535 [Myxococcus xanthus]QDE80165.1 hypothetical protein BHS07_00525 [Myxococcus xanthus]QDE94481.1 hypothetical protein BHS05_00545 [Myxococcus xanthus]QDF01706.1 hypothetical protein BHS04_00535 [Myxococcus xanthus]
MSLRKDYIERLIEEFAAALARIIKARREKKLADAQRLIQETALSTLGMEYTALLMADPMSTARLLGSPTRVKVLARLVAEDGELIAEQGDAATATSRFHYALALYDEVQVLGLTLDADDTATIARLRGLLTAPDAH